MSVGFFDVVNPFSHIGHLAEGTNNFLTGDLDWERQLELNSVNNAFTAGESEKAWNRSEESARNQRQWVEDMQNSYYSRMVKSAQEAGLNPYAVLSGGASVPSGASGSAYSANASNASAVRSSQGIGAVLGAVLSAVTGGAFGLAKSAMIAKSKQNLAAQNSAFETQYFNKYGQFTGSTVRRSI